MFAELSRASQLTRVRAAALEALKQYGIEPQSIRLVNFGFNSTYKIVDASGCTFALRISINSKKSRANVEAEVQFLKHIAANTNLNIPRLRPTLAGEDFVSLSIADSALEHFAMLYDWVEGNVIGDKATSKQLRAVGASMATLHVAARGWNAQAPAELKRIDDAFQGEPNHILTNRHRFTDTLNAQVDRILPKINQTFESLRKTSGRLAIHADLHPGNCLWNAGQIGIIDFDDFGFGLPQQDLTIATFYLRQNFEAEKHILAGYSSVAELPPLTPEQFELMIVSRALMLLSDLLVNTTAELIEFLPKYIERTERRLEVFEAEGRFKLISE